MYNSTIYLVLFSDLFVYSYFINYLNKTTTWDDPRLRYRHVPVTPQHMQITSLHESIPLQVSYK